MPMACSIRELLFATTPRAILQSDQEVITLLTSLAPQLRKAGIHAVLPAYFQARSHLLDMCCSDLHSLMEGCIHHVSQLLSGASSTCSPTSQKFSQLPVSSRMDAACHGVMSSACSSGA